MISTKRMRGEDGAAPGDVRFSYQPQSSFTRTFGWMLCVLPLVGIVAGVVDLVRGNFGVAAATMGISVAVAGLLYLFSRIVDRAQERIRLEVASDGTMRFRNVVGRTRSIPLRGARDFSIKELRSAPKTVTRGRDFELRDRRLSEVSPHFVEIRVRDSSGHKHKVMLSGAIPRNELRELHRAVDEFIERQDPNHS